MMEEIKKFVWTEDLVKEWTAWYSLKNERSKNFTMFKDLEEFKKSKEVKKDYAIMSFVNEYNEIVNRDRYTEFILDNLTFKGTIHSVKRLSSSETFSIGDNYKGCVQCNTHTIVSFEILNNELIVKREDGREINFATIIKVKEPLFITEDNVLCYGGEIVYGVAIQGTVSDLICSAKIPFGFDRKRTNRKWFSNEFAAQEYALLNKELFSINDLTKNDFVYAYLTESFDKLKELAKKKLNQ